LTTVNKFLKTQQITAIEVNNKIVEDLTIKR